MKSISLEHEVFVPRVYSICVSASIQNSGQEKITEFYQENSYYIDVNDSNLNSNPLMNFAKDFGFDNDEGDVQPPYLIIQTMNKSI